MQANNILNIVYAVSFIDLLGVGMVFPLFSTHLRNLGASHTLIGITSAVYSGTQVLSGPLIGGWSDVQDRKYVLKQIILISAVAYGTLGLTNYVFVIFFVRFILGVFKHIQSICKAVITDLLPRKKQTEAFGKTAALGSLGFTIGPFIGGHLSELNHGFCYACFLAMLIFFINIVLVSFLPEFPNVNMNKKTVKGETNNNNVAYLEIVKKAKKEFRKTIDQLKKVNWSIHADGFLIRLLYGLTTSCFFSNQALFLREVHNLSQKHIGYVLSFFGVFGMTSAYFLNYINRFYTNDTDCYKRTLHFFGIMSLCICGFYSVPNIYLFLGLLVPFSLSHTMMRIVTMEILLKKSGEIHKGSLSGASNSVMSVARFITLIVTGFLGDLFNEQTVILVSLLPALLGIFISLKMIKKRNL